MGTTLPMVTKQCMTLATIAAILEPLESLPSEEHKCALKPGKHVVACKLYVCAFPPGF